MTPIEKALAYNLKLASFMANKKETMWSSRPLEDYWSHELIVKHPLRILIRWLYLFPVAGVTALFCYLMIGGGLYFFGKGIIETDKDLIIRGVMMLPFGAVGASLCTAFLTRQIIETIDLMILMLRGKNAAATVVKVKTEQSGTPASPINSLHVEVYAEIGFDDGIVKKIFYYGKTPKTGLHKSLEKGLEPQAPVKLCYDSKNIKRARIVY